MFALNSHPKYYLYAPATDMRKGFDGLSGLLRNELERDPLSGDVFIFLNRWVSIHPRQLTFKTAAFRLPSMQYSS